MDTLRHPIFLYIGQFGCQLGSHVVEIVSLLKYCPLLTDEKVLSAIFVDTEEKVICNLDKLPCFLKFVKKVNLVFDNGACSGNWIKAYNNDKLVNVVLQQVRDEIMKCRKESFLVFVHSLIGATGSGLTSRLLKELKDVYPNTMTISITVLPFSTGEASLQHYNSLLILDVLDRYCDITFLLTNDSLLQNTKMKNNPRPTLSDMNYQAAIAAVTLLSVICNPSKHEKNVSYNRIDRTDRPSSYTVNRKRATDSNLKKRSNSLHNTDFQKSVYFSRYSSELYSTKAIVPLTENVETELNPLKLLSSCGRHSFYLIEVTLTADVNRERLHTNLIQKCARYDSSKPKLHNAFLFQPNLRETISSNEFIASLQKRFQLVSNSYQLFNEHQSFFTSKNQNDTGLVICFQTDFIYRYFDNIVIKAQSMVDNNVFIHYYKKKKGKQINFKEKIEYLKSLAHKMKT